MKKIDWPVTLFLILVPLLAVILTSIYFCFFTASTGLVVFAIVFSILTELAITAGYHRLFSHRSYEAIAPLKWLLVLVGTSAWQGSVFQWVTGHRQHHAHEDTDDDPYSINKGFWYAHMGWMLVKQEFRLGALDLQKDPLLRFQHQHYVSAALLTGFMFPTCVGALMGDPWGGLILGGFLRIAVTQHFTYFINSLCHSFGRQTYCQKITARDSFLVAVLTQGEGYHNYHHRFQADYRNGVKWYHWDPTKWAIRFFWLLGLARRLRKMPHQEILKARLQVEAARLKAQGYSLEKLELLKNKIFARQHNLRKLQSEFAKTKMKNLKSEIGLAKLEFEFEMKRWKLFKKNPILPIS